MKFINTEIKDLIIIKPKIFNDPRGYFMESYRNDLFKKKYPDIDFVQENESYSKRGVLRGLHFQKPPYDQVKLVRVVVGEVLDVVVDLRKTSKSYGKHLSFILSDSNKNQLLIPSGFAHGFLVRSEYAIFSYKVNNVYNKQSEDGILFNTPSLNIDWNQNEENILVSEKDKKLQDFKNFKSPF